MLDPSPRCPTAQVADGVVVGALDDARGRAPPRPAGRRDHARHRARAGDRARRSSRTIAPVRPGARCCARSRTAWSRSSSSTGSGCRRRRGRRSATPAELDAALARLGRPAILKVRRAGYDGKGQVRIDPETRRARASSPGCRGEPAVAEEVVRFAREISRDPGARAERRDPDLPDRRERAPPAHPAHDARAGADDRGPVASAPRRSRSRSPRRSVMSA